MWDNDIILLYRRMMVNMVFDWLEETYSCYFSDSQSEIIQLDVEERSDFSRVTFNAVFLSFDPSRSSDFICLQGVVDVTSHGIIDDVDVNSEYLNDIREVQSDD